MILRLPGGHFEECKECAALGIRIVSSSERLYGL